MLIDKSKLYSGIIYDSLKKIGVKDEECVLDQEIKLINGKDKIFGPVFTCSGRSTFSKEEYSSLDSIRYEIYRTIKSGYVVVLSSNDDLVAHAGDLTCLIYKKLGCEGFITDGLIRDSNLIKEYSFPCACKGNTPIDALGRWAITEYEKPILIKSSSNSLIEIEQNDYIFADNDGALVIKKVIHKDFFDVLEKEIKREALCRETITKSNPEDIYDNVIKLVKNMGRW